MGRHLTFMEVRLIIIPNSHCYLYVVKNLSCYESKYKLLPFLSSWMLHNAPRALQHHNFAKRLLLNAFSVTSWMEIQFTAFALHSPTIFSFEFGTRWSCSLLLKEICVSVMIRFWAQGWPKGYKKVFNNQRSGRVDKSFLWISRLHTCFVKGP